MVCGKNNFLKTTTFDDFEEAYDESLQKGLALSGEDKNYFARERVLQVGQALGSRPAGRILDYGCGTGSATPWLLALPGAKAVTGTDPSEKSLARARIFWTDGRVKFVNLKGLEGEGGFDTAFTNGVFHHIPPLDRRAALKAVFSSLRENGMFFFWENNPWNPGTRWVMSRIPFDREAILLWPNSAARLLRATGFTVLGIRHYFIFPRFLKIFRFLEPALARIPLGAQYMIAAQKVS